jgi:hypothetical protein
MRANNDLAGLIKFLARDEWRARLEETIGEHVGPALEMFDLEFDEIGDALGEHWGRTLWGCAFEDLLTRQFEPDGRNLIDEYLVRRGWNESVSNKTYMRALKAAVMSLYEVSQVVPGKSFLARDLVRGGEPVLVSERSATQTLKDWDRIAARIVPIGQKHIMAGGLLPFSPEASELLMDGLSEIATGGAVKGRRPARLKKASVISDGDLTRVAALFTTAWLVDVLPRAMGLVSPAVCNSEGDEIVFHHVRFPKRPKAKVHDLIGRLDALPALRRESKSFWNWLDEPTPAQVPARKRRAENATAWNVTMEDGATVLGNIEIKPGFVVLIVNSATRAERGTALLRRALGDLVGVPLTEIQTIEQMMADHPDGPESGVDIPIEVQTELVHGMLDKQYREVLDQPVGMLGDVTPRVAARTAKGREKIAAWLKYLENRTHQQRDPNDPMATYDFGWLWRELKVENLRR